MPILGEQEDRFPNELWSSETTFAPDGRWWCAHTKPKQEKSLARELGSSRVMFYLPQVERIGKTPGGRARKSRIPLFPSYVFLFGDDTARLLALKTNRIVKLLFVEFQTELQHDLRQIHQILSAGGPMVHEPHHPVGSWVRIAKGPLEGLVGVVARRGKRNRFTSIVRYIGQGVSIDLEDSQVEPFTPPPGGHYRVVG